MKRLFIGTLAVLAIAAALAPAANAFRLDVAGCPAGETGRCVGGEG